MEKITIAGRDIGKGNKPFIIAEIGQNHDGSLGIAHSYIDAVAETGADAIKFQTHIAEAESSLQDEFRVKFSYEDKTRYDYWKRMEFTPEQWEELYRHARSKDLVFLSSPFSLEAARLLNDIGCPAWKIGSGEVNNDILMKYLGQTGKPILLSTGMSSYSEIDRAVEKIRKMNPVGLFQCTSKYPTSYEDVGLNVIDALKEKYRVPVGLSDHSGDIFPPLFAVARGADMVEAHVTFHKSMFGPDIVSSILLDELKMIVDAAKAAPILNGVPVDKDQMADDLRNMKYLFEKSIALRHDLQKGEKITAKSLKGLKPGSGIPVARMEDIIGKKVTKDITKNSILFWEDIS